MGVKQLHSPRQSTPPESDGCNRDNQAVEEQFEKASLAYRDGRVEAAAQLCEHVLAGDGQHADSWHLLGLIAHQMGQSDRAVVLIRRAIELNDDSAVYYSDLGHVLFEMGNATEAIGCLKRALDLDSTYVNAHYNLGVALQVLGNAPEAEASYLRALALKPNYPEALSNLGLIAERRGSQAAAIAFYQRAIALDPTHASAHNNMGALLMFMGRLDEARYHFETATRLAPRNGQYFLNLAQTIRFSEGDPHLAALESLTREESSLTPPDLIPVEFALGKAYADAGEPERSFRHLLRGNQLNRQRVTYHEQATLGRHDSVQRVFTRELLAHKADLGDASPVPVFVVGMPRSGTTLVEQILASHPKIHGAGEINDLEEAIASVPIPEGIVRDYPEVVSYLQHELAAIGATYIARLGRYAPKAERIVDKMPGNFLHVGLIRLAMPNAHIIHVSRDPVDTCLSCFSQLFTEGHEYSYDLGELGRYYASQRRVMQHWRSVLPPGAMFEIQYEELVAEPERHSRAMLDYCGLDWDPACLQFQRTERLVRTASATQVRQPIYQTAIGRAAAYRHLLQPLLSALS